MPEETILTKEGFQKLSEELEYLKTTKRKEIAERIRVARGFGDLSENGEYDAAKDEQALVENRISLIEDQLRHSRIIGHDLETAGDDSEVQIGTTVKILDVEFNDEMIFTLVGTVEADPKKNKISNESPLGRALIGRKEGETVDVETQGGPVVYKILEIIR